jgi:hypothetical protein
MQSWYKNEVLQTGKTFGKPMDSLHSKRMFTGCS